MPTEETEDLPGFAPVTSPGPDSLDPETTVFQQGPPSPGQDRPKVSASADEVRDETARAQSTSSTSSRASSEDIDEALAGYGAGGFFLASVGLNKLVVARTKKPTQRWLATEDETQRFGDALGRVAARRVPAEIIDNPDAADYLIMGEVVVNYGLRNALGLTPEEAAAAGEAYLEAQAAEARAAQAAGREQTPQYAEPPPTAPAPRAVPADEPEVTQNTFGAVAATPPPPSVIAPTI